MKHLKYALIALISGSVAASGYFTLGGGGGASGPAGGDLAGTYPNPTLAVDRVRLTGDTMTGNLQVPSLNGISSSVIAYLQGATANIQDQINNIQVTGTPSTPASFDLAGLLVSTPNWGVDATYGEYTYNYNPISGVTVPSSTIIALYPNYVAGSGKLDDTGFRYGPSYQNGSYSNSISALGISPNVDTPFNYSNLIDFGPNWQANAVGSGVTAINIHDTFQTGSQLTNGYIGGQVGIAVSSASLVNGYSAWRDTSTFITGASVTSGIISFGSYPQVGVTVPYLNAMDIGSTLQSGTNINGSVTGFNEHYQFQPGSVVNGSNGIVLNNQYQAGSSIQSHVGVQHNPQFLTELTNYFSTFDDSTNFDTGSKVTNPQGLNLHMQFQSGSTMSGNLTYVNITPNWQAGTVLEGTSSASLINISPQSSVLFNSMDGISINMTGVTLANGTQPVGVNNQGGFSSNYLSNIPNSGFAQFNYLGGQAIIPSGSPVTGTLTFGANLASGLLAQDNFGDDGTGLNLGFVDVGFVGSMAVLSGVTVDAVSMALGGFGIPAASTGGTIEDVSLFHAVGGLPQGGTLNITNMKAFLADSILCGVVSGTCRGLSIEDPLADNYIAGTLQTDKAITVNDGGGVHLSGVSTYIGGDFSFLAAGTNKIIVSDALGAVTGLTTLPIGQGGTGQTTASAAFNALSLPFLPSKGDIAVSGATGMVRVPVGGDMRVLVADSVAFPDSGVGWQLINSIQGIGTPNTAAYFDGSGFLSSSVTTDTELGYLSGATANIQTQINAISVGTPVVATPGDADYSILAGDTFVRTNVALTTTRTYTLPACTTGTVGKIYYIKKSVATGSDLSVALTGGDTLDGGAGPFTVTGQGTQNVFCAANTKWENF